ncbi:MAG: ParA family partition ATPase [Pseudomonadota bacterium]
MAKVISIAQQKGGAGKSTIAAHLAVALFQQGKRVTLVDIDPQGSLTMWHSLREKQYGKGYTGINFISSSGWRVGNAISQYKSHSDFIIIDSPPHTETEAKGAIREADLVIIPMQPSPTDLWATKATLDFAKSEKKLVKILLNRYNPTSKIARDVASRISDALICSIGNRVLFSSCFMQGRCVTESDPQSQAANEIKALTEEVLGLMGEGVATPLKEKELAKA